MPPKSVAKMSSTSIHNCRRSRRIAYRIKKSMAKGQSSVKESEKPLYRKKSVAKTQPTPSEQSSSTKEGEKPSSDENSDVETQPESSNGGQPSSTRVGRKTSYKKVVTKTQPASMKERGKSSNSKKSVTKRQLASSNKRQSTSTKNSSVKKRRVMKTDEINGGSSQVRQQDPEDFSIYVEKILEELSPDLTISDEALADMNIYLNHIFNLLAMTSAISHQLGSSDSMTDNEIEQAVARVVEGDLAKYCIAEGRRGVKKWNEEE